MKKLKILLSALLLAVVVIFPNSYNSAHASTAKIDEYLSVNSVSKKTDNTISINYTIKKNFAPGSGTLSQSLSLGYEWPAEYRLGSGSNYSKIVNYSKGTYTMTIPAPASNIIGTQKVVAKYVAYSYSETKHVQSVKNVPPDVTVKFHTVTKAEAAGNFIVGVTIPGAIITFAPFGKYVKAVGGAYLAWTTYTGLSDTMNLSSSLPMPKAGHYYQITTFYNQSGLNVHKVIWTNKESYDKGVTPIYNQTTVFNW